MVRIVAAAVCHLVLCCCLASAQDSGAGSASEGNGVAAAKPPETALPAVEESRPSVSYVPDKDGVLQPVIGWTWEEIEQLWLFKEQLAQPQRQPRYSIQRIAITGTAVAKHAELTIVFEVLVREDKWVRVPLRLDRGVLREVAYQGAGEQFVHFEGDDKGYVSWIRGGGGEEGARQQHQLTLTMLMPLEEAGRETSLKLLLPRAVSELKLKVPVAKAVGRVSEEAILKPRTDAADGTSEFTVLGRGGDLELAWRPADGPVAVKPTVLEATGAVFVEIDGHRVDTQAMLEVRSQGGPFDRFRVRLPEGAELIPGSPSGYSVVPVDEAGEAASTRPMVEIRLTEPSSGPIQVRLTTRQSHNVGKANEWFELAGFDVVGAAQQWGHLAVAVAGDWDVRWRPSGELRRIEVDQLPQTLRQEGVVTGFEYFAQPCSLEGQTLLKGTRVQVEPVYLLLVDAHEVRLQADLKYTVRGAKAFKLKVAMPPGWELLDVGPENLVAVDSVAVFEPNVLSIPLAEASTGRFDLQLRARWPIPPGADSLVLPLPRPLDGSPAPTVVVVAPADNVALSPSDDSMVGLDEQQIDPELPRPDDREQLPLCYRGDGGENVFAADFRVHPQQIAVEVVSKVRLDEQVARVEQKLVYTIKHQRKSQLTLTVPRVLADSNGFELLHEGQLLQPIETSLNDKVNGNDNGKVNDSGNDALEPIRMRIALPRPCIGRCELTVKHVLPIEKLIAGEPVPLVMPDEGELTRNEVEVTAAAKIQVQAGSNAWTVLEAGVLPEDGGPGGPSALRLKSDRRNHYVELLLRRGAGTGGKETTIVERAWVQTWLTDDSRQDRAVFSFTSNRKQLQLTLPAEAGLYLIELDGKEVPQGTSKQRRLIIPLPEKTGRHLLEIRSRVAQPRPPRGELAIAIAQLGEDTCVRRLYWQLVLPQNEHVITNPKGFAGEFTWGFNGYFWGRMPLMDQSQLEAWVDVPAESFHSTGANCYLFSSMGQVDLCELRTASRTWIVLLTSGSALVVGLLLIFFPACRHPGALFVAAIVLLSLGLLYPEPALLAAQAASLGLALTLLAGLLQRSVVRRRTEARETGSSVLEKGSTQTLRQLPGAGNQISTQTAPPVVLPPSPDPDP